MTVLIVLGAIALVIFGLMMLKATLTIEYRDDVALYVKVLFLKIRILPKKNKPVNYRKFTAKKLRKLEEKKRKKELKKWKKKQQKAAKKAAKKEAREADRLAGKHPEPKKRSLIENISLVKALLGAVMARFAKRLRVKLTRIVIVVASDDAAKTAMLYGLAAQGVAYIIEGLDHLTNLKYAPEAEVSVTADFLAEKPTADLKIAFSLRVWHLFDVLFRAVFVYLKEK